MMASAMVRGGPQYSWSLLPPVAKLCLAVMLLKKLFTAAKLELLPAVSYCAAKLFTCM